jgi:hypothetical protein
MRITDSSRPGRIPILLLAVLAACGGDGEDPADRAAALDGFWASLSLHCGNAYPGSLTLEPPGDDMLQGDELLVVHFRSCSERELQLPFHIELEEGEWNRSRTWIFTRTGDGRMELRHDHRLPDGTDDEFTWYGGFTETAGTETRQEFIYRDVDYPDGSTRGWRIEIEPDVRYTYGTIRNGEWSWRVDFDLTRPLPEEPPPPWGY